MSAATSVWLMICTALVLLMTPAVGLFYGGLVRRKNVLSTVLYSFITMAIISIQWIAVGYSLSFGPSLHGFVGGFEYLGLAGVSAATPETGVSPMLHMLFQMTFAVITPALISGAFVERKKFPAFLVFVPLWATLVYCPVAHWVWGKGGWLAELGALDFAGGTVVHITSGVAALVCAIMIGPRRGFGEERMEPHNGTITFLGASLLWFGWFGFNGGSAPAADGIAVNALVTTNAAAAAGALAWLAMAWSIRKKPSALGATVGAVAGLVGITPAAGFVSPIAAIVIGAITSATCYIVAEVWLRDRVDDSLGVFGVHGVGGIVGALLTGVFASTAVNPAGADGLIHGNGVQLLWQLAAVVAVVAFTALMTFAILTIVSIIVGIRVSAHEEAEGLDLSLHGEAAYSI